MTSPNDLCPGSEVNQKAVDNNGTVKGEQQITLDPHGKLTAQITLDPHGKRAACGERGREEKKKEAQRQRGEKDWYREGHFFLPCRARHDSSDGRPTSQNY